MTSSLQPTSLQAPAPPRTLPLENGDRLTRDEFERRYEAMPHMKKAELIEGEVHVPTPVRCEYHGEPHSHLITWLGVYLASTPGLQIATDASVRLDLDNEPQPDGVLRVRPEYRGQSRTSPEGYIEGAPELAAEIAASSASYDLHSKLSAYRRNGVREYVVVRVLDREVDWFALRGSEYQHLAPDASGLLKSEVFPGLWLDPAALVRGDLARVLAVVADGTHSPEHAAFTQRLEEASRK